MVIEKFFFMFKLFGIWNVNLLLLVFLVVSFWLLIGFLFIKIVINECLKFKFCVYLKLSDIFVFVDVLWLVGMLMK